ncbi:MAG: hypothetical protein NTV34_04580, partial [Proteobacteria bacterium]|nr:hypothetical protein [Pseudomonadota bacterium]
LTQPLRRGVEYRVGTDVMVWQTISRSIPCLAYQCYQGLSISANRYKTKCPEEVLKEFLVTSWLV